MPDMTTETRIETRPYKPSWIDRFSNWVEKLPMREWVFYVGLGLGLIWIQMLLLWLDGGLCVFVKRKQGHLFAEKRAIWVNSSEP